MKKRTFIISLTTLCCWGILACNDTDTDDTRTADTVANESVTADTSTSSITPQSSTPADSATAMFITKAASGGMMEVQLGQLAQQQAQSQRVKDYGAMMVRDHGKANDELKSLASTKNVILSDSLTAEHKRHVTNLQSKKGTAFDKAYMSMMVQDHQKDIKEFEKASNELPDAEVKGFATRTLPVLKTHLDSATAINRGKAQQ
jgi:putative membrane protein